MCLNILFQTGGTVLRDYGLFKRWDLTEGKWVKVDRLEVLVWIHLLSTVPHSTMELPDAMPVSP